MKISLKSLLWSAAALLLMLTIITPINVITTFLVMTPFVVLYAMLRPAAFAAHAVAIGLAVFFLLGGYGPIAVTLAFFFVVPSLVMGHMYKKGSSAKSAIIAGFVVVLAQLLLELAIFSVQFDINLAAELTKLLSDSLSQFETNGMFPAGWSADMAKDLSDAVVTMLPMLLLMSAFLFAVITHVLSRRALRTVGIAAAAFPQARTWQIPRSLVLYYLIAIIASFAITEESAGYWSVAIANLVPILRFAFTIQAIGLVFFVADAKKWPRFAPILLSIPLLLFPPLYLVGLLDVAFPLRRYFAK